MPDLVISKIEETSDVFLKYFEQRIQAGFPSPAQGSFADAIDLNRELINTPEATFCARVIGDSMIDMSIAEGDLLIIDRSLTPRDGDIAVCFVDGDFTVKKISLRDDGIYLVAANRRFPEIRVPEESHFMIWGVVSHIIKKVNR